MLMESSVSQTSGKYSMLKKKKNKPIISLLHVLIIKSSMSFGPLLNRPRSFSKEKHLLFTVKLLFISHSIYYEKKTFEK